MRVLTEGVTRTFQHGLAAQVIQHKVKGVKNIAKVKGTVKAAVLEGCPSLENCPLVAASV